MPKLPALLLSFVLFAAAPAPFTPYLVKDINPWPTPSNTALETFVTLGDLALFEVWRPVSFEMWRTDGTASGTYQLIDSEEPFEIFAVTNRLCFFNRLWVTDGTLPGTFHLANLKLYPDSGGRAWAVRKGVLYFVAEGLDQGHGAELWRSDGTPGGTHEVADIWPGPGSSKPAYLTSFQDRLYFSASDPVHGSALWQSDGTAQGTVPVRDVPVTALYAVGPRLVFLGADSAHGLEPWVSDGTAAGTRRIADLAKGVDSPDYLDFKVIGQRLFFTAAASAAQGQELYWTDGTAQGTRKLTSFAHPEAVSVLPQAVLGNRLFFPAYSRTNGTELWLSDGTVQGTHMVLDTCPGKCSSVPSPLFLYQSRLYYQATDGTHGDELWVTDGTAQGTHLVEDICPGQRSSWLRVLSGPGDRPFFTSGCWDWAADSLWTLDGTEGGLVSLPNDGGYFQGTVAGGKLFFSSTRPDFGSELWSSDGTPEGTHILADCAYDVGGSEPHGLMPLGEKVLFFAHDGTSRGALWRSDGTEAGTTEVKQGLSFRRGRWTASASRVFFQVNGPHAFELWTSDGTEAGTVRLTPDGVFSQGGLSAPVGSRIFFSGWSLEHGVEPWVTDGTLAGTRLVADLRPGPADSLPHGFMVFAGRGFFVARSRLWKSDGTGQGTVALGPALSDLEPRTPFGGKLWFTGRNNRGLTELWATNGTVARTIRIAELRTAEHFTVHAGRLWFVGDGTELWSLDGTAAGAHKLDLRPWVDGSISGLVSDGLHLYLTDSRNRLWVSNGTVDGTRKISDQGVTGPSITFAGRLYYSSLGGDLYRSNGTEPGTRPVRPGDGPKRVGRLLRLGTRLVLVAEGGKLWQSDGTAAGTTQLYDPSPDWSVGPEIVKAGPRLFFPAWNKEIGSELWAIH